MILPRLKFSRKKHIPMLVLFGFEAYPWQINNLIHMMRGRVAGKDLIQVRLFGFDVNLVRNYFDMIMGELSLWEQFYAPVALKGRTVLDVGAGTGETAAFYFSKGAKKVVAIEPNPLAFNLLKENTKMNSWNLDSINDVFRLEHLSIPHDFLKIDCEGGETILFNYEGSLGPCVIESHSTGTTRELMSRFHFSSIISTRTERPETSLLINSKEES